MLNIRRAKLFDASTDTTFRSRSRDSIYKSSTSCHRLSSGQNVFRSVLVSVQMLAAVFAFELSNFQAKASVDISATVTPLAAGKEPVRNAQLAPIPSAFVGQHLPEQAEAGATDVFGELVILDHPAHVQVLNRQNIEPAHQVGCELVERVLPAVGNLGVQSCHFQPLLIPSATTLDAPVENPLQSRQPCGMAGSVTRVGNFLPGGERCQPANSKVNPDLFPSLVERGLGWFIQTKTHEVTSVPALGYRAGSWLARETATPLDVETTDFGNCKVAIIRIPFESVDRVFSGLFAMLGSELWIGCPLSKKIGERGLQMPQSLLLRYTGRFTQPSELRVGAMFCESRAAGVVIDRLAVLEAVGAEAQGEVIDVTRTTELPRQLPRLAVGRVESVCVSNFHKATIHLV